MTTEAARHDMITALEGALGKEAAMTLADHLPPSGWSDVARAHDLELLEARMESLVHREVSSVRAEISATTGALRSELANVQRTLFFSILGASAASAGITLTAVLAVGS